MTAEAGGSSPPRPSGLESKLGRQTIGSQSPSPWRSQLCHAFREPGGYTRSQEDTKKIQFEYRRNRADTHTTREDNAIAPVRDREAPGSNPGPPTIFGFKIGIPRAVCSQTGHTISWGTIATGWGA